MVQIQDITYEIVLLLLNGENHLRSIARMLKSPHTTLQRKINNLVKNNILDFKIKGKNKVFFIRNTLQAKKYIHNAENYKLLKLVEEYPELGVIIEDILKTVKDKLVILFGSYAKFNAKQGSDIDIYVETNSRKTKQEIEDINSKLSVKIGKFDEKSLLIKEIIKNHVILKGVEEYHERTRTFD